MLQKEAQHFVGGVDAAGVSVAAARMPARPRMPRALQQPMLSHHRLVRLGAGGVGAPVHGAGETLARGGLALLRVGLHGRCAALQRVKRCLHQLFTIAGVNGAVRIAMKNNQRWGAV